MKNFSKLLIVFFVILLPYGAHAAIRLGSANTVSLMSGLVGYWTMDGTDTVWSSATAGTVKDRSGNGNTGTLNSMNRASSPASGKIGQTLKFNGTTQSVTAPLPTTATDNMTLAAWVYWDGNTSGNPFPGIVYIGNTASNGYGFVLSNGSCAAGNKLGIQMIGSLCDALSSNYTLPTNKWTHIVGERSNGTWYLYVNGVLQVTGGTTGPITPTTQISIGSSGQGFRFFGGLIDDVRVYNRALSATEIAQLYKLGTVNPAHSNNTSLSSGLVGYWPLDGADTVWTSTSAATTKDRSGNGNTGTLNSMSISSSPIAGKIAQALNFNGSTQYISTAAGPGLSTAATLSVWVKTSQTEAQAINYPLSTGSSGTIRLSLWVGGNFAGDSQIAVKAIGLFDGTNAASAAANSFTTTDYGKWHHIVAVYDSNAATKTQIYKDGVALSMYSNNITGTLPSQNQVNIGRRTDSLFYFNGNIDDAHIYNRALSANEVKQLYAQGTANVAHSNTTSLSSGLVGYWTFDGSDTPWTTAFAATTKDKSGNGNTGTLTNMGLATSTVAGKIGQALRFDGNNSSTGTYISVANAAIFNSMPAFTISGWVKLSAYNSQYNTILSKKLNSIGVTADPYELYTLTVDPTGHLFVAVSTGSSGSRKTALSGGTLSLNAWHFVVGTWDGTTVRGYIDGVADGSAAAAITMGSANFPIVIGGEQSGAGSLGTTPGSIDDVRLYNRALSIQEITQLYTAGK